MLPEGKGFYIWQVPKCDKGDVGAIAAIAKAADLHHAFIKVADGTKTYNVTSAGVDLVYPLVLALRAVGISVWGWGYVYGDFPEAEAEIGVKRMRDLDLDGYIVDAESQYKAAGKATAAKTYMAKLRAGVGALPIGLSSYRYPTPAQRIPVGRIPVESGFQCSASLLAASA